MPQALSPARRAKIAAEIAAVQLRRKHDRKPDFRRLERKTPQRVPRIVAYDFETDIIGPGTPRPRYLTAYAPELVHLQTRVETMAQLHAVIVRELLREDLAGARFVAWNGNRFDAYYIAAALLADDRYLLRPYLTRTKALRGLRVELIDSGLTKGGKPRRKRLAWEFLDGISMLGLTGTRLETFAATFAPDLPKLGGPDFEAGEQFDPDNPEHVAYAWRDSVALWHGMQRAQDIMLETFGQPLGVTMGGACIKIFQAHIPEGVTVRAPIPILENILRAYVMRGGYCHLQRRYKGPVWKYDLNQAYAAAMRDAALPCGDVMPLRELPKSGAYIARITARHPTNLVPFYYRSEVGGRMQSLFATTDIADTWLTCLEVEQLQREGWTVKVRECWAWGGTFSMREYVDKLEHLRTTCEGGPKGPIGTMVKATGNHSYGRTVEQIEPIEYALAARCPDGFEPFYDGLTEIEHVYYRLDDDRRPKSHHQPQIGAWITAHVRMQVRRAALLAPDAWLYADTDCVVFTRDVTELLDIDPARYGAWKVEETGAIYQFIAKKVYAKIIDAPTFPKGAARSAKGMRARELTPAHFDRWFAGQVPEQMQTQLGSFLAVMHGAQMFRQQPRKGTAP
jgi:hypothetical protein